MTRAELQSIKRAFEERNPKRLLVGETRLLFDHVAAMERRLNGVRCRWCAEHPGQTHRAAGAPLFDQLHHAGQYVTPEESDRIAADGP
jgi:hypothetical protein